MPNLSERQQHLQEWLHTQKTASISEIEKQFEISPATAYRDARALIQAGMAVKTSNGIKIAVSSELEEEKCAFCGGKINERLAFIFQLEDSSQCKSCCPHCGLMALGRLKVRSAMATDFLYGHMVNVRDASYLLESSVNICCTPSVLCFTNEKVAMQFQSGFGGHICSLEAAVEQVEKMMAL
jgi:DeoR family transcriptional regulator, copper-sensing transcriptional repressor